MPGQPVPRPARSRIASGCRYALGAPQGGTRILQEERLLLWRCAVQQIEEVLHFDHRRLAPCGSHDRGLIALGQPRKLLARRKQGRAQFGLQGSPRRSSWASRRHTWSARCESSGRADQPWRYRRCDLAAPTPLDGVAAGERAGSGRPRTRQSGPIQNEKLTTFRAVPMALGLRSKPRGAFYPLPNCRGPVFAIKCKKP